MLGLRSLPEVSSRPVQHSRVLVQASIAGSVGRSRDSSNHLGGRRCQRSTTRPPLVMTSLPVMQLGRKFLAENGLKHVRLSTADGVWEAASAGVSVRSKRALLQRKGVLEAAHEILERPEAHIRARTQVSVTANMRGESMKEVGEQIIRATSFPALQDTTVRLQGPLLPPPEFLPRKVAVFWDLDNKPPKNIPPYNAALHLKNLASGFGDVVDVVAYANRHAFTFIPEWVRQERRERKILDQLELRGQVKVSEPYVCSLCGRRCKTNLLLKKHFKEIHERERNKRLKHLDHLKGKRRAKFRQKFSENEVRYKEAARGIILPKLGYGLATELRRAGIFVRTVQDQPQAADIALKRHMLQSLKQGVKCICLVSDDSDFGDILRMARHQKLRTVVVGDTKTLKSASDMWFSWDDVASGKARFTANEDYDRWINEDALARELLDDEDEDEDEKFEIELRNVYDDDDDDDDDFSYPSQRVTKVSPFSDEDANDLRSEDGVSASYAWDGEFDSDDEFLFSADDADDKDEEEQEQPSTV